MTINTKKSKLLADMQAIYGIDCIICQQQKSTILLPIISHESLRAIRRMNKRKSRQNFRQLPVFSTWHQENLLSVCNNCYNCWVKRNVFKIEPQLLLRIDNIRLQHGFILLHDASCLHRFRTILFEKLTKERYE